MDAVILKRVPGRHRARPPAGKRVRCLGPGREHTFPSADPTTNRVCPACRVRLAAASVREQYPVRGGSEQ